MEMWKDRENIPHVLGLFADFFFLMGRRRTEVAMISVSMMV
jgi:hypothetical protein